jgi:hypothetical protein
MHVDEHRIFVHAGVDQNFSLDEQDPQDVVCDTPGKDLGGDATRSPGDNWAAQRTGPLDQRQFAA